MKTVFFFLFLFSTHVAFSQKAVIKEIQEIHTQTKEKYIFPVVVIPGNDQAGRKINMFLREEMLWLDSGNYKKNPFENVWPGAPDGYWIFTNFEYKILGNEPNYTSLTISCTGGRYEQLNTKRFSFDNATGEPIKLEQLFTKAGRQKILDTMWKGQNKRIIKAIAASRDSMKNSLDARRAKQKNFYKEYIEDMEELIRKDKECLERDRSTGMEFYNFYLKKDSIVIEGEGCGDSREDLRLGVLGDYTFSASIKGLERYLSAYGKKILMGRP